MCYIRETRYFEDKTMLNIKICVYLVWFQPYHIMIYILLLFYIVVKGYMSGCDREKSVNNLILELGEMTSKKLCIFNTSYGHIIYFFKKNSQIYWNTGYICLQGNEWEKISKNVHLYYHSWVWLIFKTSLL